MLKLSDPFEMKDLFVGIFYDAENEALAMGEGSQKSNQRLKQFYQCVRAVWRDLLLRFDGNREAAPPSGQPKALTPESRHLDAGPNENATFEFRPLTEEEKRQFLNSLDEKGRRILAELEGESRVVRLKAAPVGIAPDIETSEKEMFSTRTNAHQNSPSLSGTPLIWRASFNTTKFIFAPNPASPEIGDQDQRGRRRSSAWPVTI